MNKQRRSIRLKGYDYSQEGMYFVTICTYNRECLFGKIVGANGCSPNMVLNDIGVGARDEWQKTPLLREDMNIKLDEFIIMPNHIHGIIVIGKNQYNIRRDTMPRVHDENRVQLDNIFESDARHRVPTNRFGVQSKNLSSITRGYKSAVTMYARKHGIQFKWQPRFYEHIIRDDNDLNRIREYIKHNLMKWKKDEYYVV